MLAILCLLLSGCAQTGPPLPPSLELPKPPTDLRANRKGNRVTLSWSEPTLTTDRQRVRYLRSARICRTLEPEMKECGFPVAQVAPPAKPNRASASPQPLQTYIDTLSAAIQEQNPSGEITYAIETPNRDGRSAGLSNQVQVATAPTLPSPSNFAAQTTASGVVVSWDGVAESEEIAAISHRYRVYRREAGEDKETVVGELPLQAGPVRLTDQSVEWEKTYVYRAEVVTTVNMGFRPCANAAVSGADCAEVREVEGDDTPEVKVVAHDVFPPAVPGGVQAVYSGAGQPAFIDLIWAPVTDADLGGYNVYRREGNGGAAVKLNAELVKSPSYRDRAVAAGKEYSYSVSAVDVRGNESAHSEEASESVPSNP